MSIFLWLVKMYRVLNVDIFSLILKVLKLDQGVLQPLIGYVMVLAIGELYRS